MIQPNIEYSEILDLVRSGDENIISRVIQLQMNINDIVDENGNGILHYVSANNDVKNIRLLLNYGATIFANNNGNTPLHWAVITKSVDAVSALLEYPSDEIDVMSGNQFGKSPVQLAFRNEENDIQILLMSHSSYVDKY